MILVNKAENFRSFEPVYDYDGSVRVLATLTTALSTAEMFRVVFTPEGYKAVPLVGSPARYYLSAAERNIHGGEDTLVKIGGPVQAIIKEELTPGRFIQFDGQQFLESPEEKEYFNFGDSAYVISRDGDSLYTLFLIPKEAGA